jgi:hypothetical protein
METNLSSDGSLTEDNVPSDGASRMPQDPSASAGGRGLETGGHALGAREVSQPVTVPAPVEDPAVPSGTADQLQALAETIRHGHQQCELSTVQGLDHARRVGEALHEVKRLLRRGEYQQWLREHCPELNPRTARHYKQVFASWPAARERHDRKRQSVAAPGRRGTRSRHPSQVATGLQDRPLAVVVRISPLPPDDPPVYFGRAQRPGADQAFGVEDGEADPPDHASAGPDAPAEQDEVGQPEAEGDPGQSGDRTTPARATAFARLCWDITETAGDVIAELNESAGGKAARDLRLLVPEAMESLREVAEALRHAAAQDSTGLTGEDHDGRPRT